MRRKQNLFLSISLIIVGLSLTGCSLKREDIGPYQGDTQLYSFTGFDRIEMGSAFNITVRQGSAFMVTAEGDRRNLDDLAVYTRNGTLYATYRNSRQRAYETAFSITLPTLRGVNFSGASRSAVMGFTNLNNLDIKLSGASESEITTQANQTNVDLSGASSLRLSGQGASLTADLSGSSRLEAFDYWVDKAGLSASGASKANVSVRTSLEVDASGSSRVRYRGAPTLRQRLSGASTVQNE